MLASCICIKDYFKKQVEIFQPNFILKGFPGAQMVKRLPGMWETQVRPLGWEDPLKKEMTTHSSTLAWKFHGLRSLVAYSTWGRKESDTTEQPYFYWYKANYLIMQVTNMTFFTAHIFFIITFPKNRNMQILA